MRRYTNQKSRQVNQGQKSSQLKPS